MLNWLTSVFLVEIRNMIKIYCLSILLGLGNFSYLFGQKNHSDSIAKLNSMILEVEACRDDTCRLNLLFNIHYFQQALLGELDEVTSLKFDVTYTKRAINLAINLGKCDTLKSLTVDLGYIFDLNKQYDSSFVYYDNCLNIFEASENQQLSTSIAQNILYNNSMLQSKIEANRKDTKRQNEKVNILTGTVLLLLFVMVGVLIFSLRKSKRISRALAHQRDLIHKSKSEIDNSINYAQNIQRSILSNERKLQSLFSDSFVLFMPRDKVSGDFLWTFKKNNLIYVAVADCTGHGVPGALISIVGHFLFDAILNENVYKSPATILTELHNRMIKAMNQDDPNNVYNHDGMDVGLLEVDLKKKRILYSGAHRSLLFVNEGVLKEYKGVKRSIGGTQLFHKNGFEDCEILYEKNSMVYCYTDGFHDQMGGANGKRFKSKSVITLISDNSNLTLEDQKNSFKESFLEYKGNHEQTDDVLMVGIKL